MPLVPSVTPLADERLASEILSPAAIEFLGEIHERFNQSRLDLVAAREGRGAPTSLLAETADIRAAEWTVPAPNPDYADRRTEITGPTSRKMVINALNSGAKGFMADFEDANSPTWHNQVEGHANLIDAVAGTISFPGKDSEEYTLVENPATLVVRPRGLHMSEKHLSFDGVQTGGSFVDFGLFVFHCGKALLDSGRGIYLYLPKLEHHLEARLWNEVISFAEEKLGLPANSVRPTVLIETLPAAFQMEEMLYELRERSYGLNAGRWDYIFSMIKCFATEPSMVLPNRADVNMTVPFMAAYTKRLVHTCHKRGAFAMGGMAALIPSRKDPEANDRAIAAVSADKQREAGMGFDGTWAAHPDVVPVAMAEFDKVLGEKPNQIDRIPEEALQDPSALIDVSKTGGAITEAGLRNNLSVAFQYISAWLGGAGAVGINGLMEDAATAEISRSQVWQWIRHGSLLEDGRPVTKELVVQLLDEEVAKVKDAVGEDVFDAAHPVQARAILEAVSLGDTLDEFLTTPAYEYID